MKQYFYFSILFILINTLVITAQQNSINSSNTFNKNGGFTAFFQEQFTNPKRFHSISFPSMEFTSILNQDVYIISGDFNENDILYGITGDQNLVTIDPNTGIVTNIATISGIIPDQFGKGLSFDFTTSTMYFLSDNTNTNTNDGSIYTIDLNTGIVSPIGNGIGIPQPTWLEIDNNGIAYVGDAETDALYTVDLTTGIANLVGSFGDIDLYSVRHGASIDHTTNTLYMLSTIVDGIFLRSFYYTIDLTTGLATDLNGPYNSNQFGMFAIPGQPNLGVETNLTNNLFAFPNPSKGEFTIPNIINYSEIYVTISNIKGQIIARKKFNNSEIINFTINAVSGLYLVKITNPEGASTTIKVLKH